jgi:hypothetical protein
LRRTARQPRLSIKKFYRHPAAWIGYFAGGLRRYGGRSLSRGGFQNVFGKMAFTKN